MGYADQLREGFRDADAHSQLYEDVIGEAMRRFADDVRSTWGTADSARIPEQYRTQGAVAVPRISAQEFEELPLRVHAFLAGVPLHDAWVIDLPRSRRGITLDEFLRVASGPVFTPSLVVGALLNVRFFIGRLFGWDRAPSTTTGAETFADRLTVADRTRSLLPAGRRDGLFRVVYRFENEQLVELINSTAHAAALSALVETASTYRFYFAVYVRSVGRLTAVYMALIDPFRKLVVYPSLLRGVCARWKQTVGAV
jgi:hypothetical protein